MLVNKIRKPLILVLTLVLCLSLVALQAFAEPAVEEEGDITIPIIPGETIVPDEDETGDCGTNLSWELDADGVLTIFGTGTQITAAPWEKSEVKTVVIEAPLTAVADYAFDDCAGLTNVFFIGTKAQWTAMNKGTGNKHFAEAIVHCEIVEGPFCNSTCFYCAECDAYYLPTGTKVTHSFTNYVSNNDATCTADGTKTAKCDRCEAKDTVADTGSKKEHKYETYVTNNDATCKADGTETASCVYNCGTKDTRTQAGSKKQHSFTNYQSNNDATWEKDGTKTAKCDYECGATDTITDEGSKLPHGWVEEEGDIWYYYYKGKMTTDWLAYGPVWYYFNADGVMRTGWLYYGGDYYYFDKAVTNFGRMVVNKWIEDGDNWYYFDASGHRVTGEYTINGEKNLFDENGVWKGVVASTQDGWVQEDGKWFYYDGGSKVTGWLDLDGTWYYIQAKSGRVTGWLQYGPVWYYFNADGVMRTGWLYYGGRYYYFDTAVTNYGRMVVNKWIKDSGKWYYFDANGYRVSNTSMTIGGKVYNFDKDGICLNP